MPQKYVMNMKKSKKTKAFSCLLQLFDKLASSKA